MQSKVTIYGHPIHPMIIVLPLGLLPASVFADLFHHILDDPTWGIVSFWLMVAGVLGGLVAGAVGFMDWKVLPVGTKARRVGAIHGLTNVLAMVVFLTSLLLRLGDSRSEPVCNFRGLYRFVCCHSRGVARRGIGLPPRDRS